MHVSLIRSRAMITRALDRHAWEEIADGAVLQEDGVIRELGTYADLKARHPHAPVVGTGEEILLPGFVNGHHHIGLTPVQLGSPDMPLELWFVTRLVMRNVNLYLDTLYSAFEMIASGVTTVQHLHGRLPWKTRSGGAGLRRGDPRLPGCRDACFLLVRGARPEPAGLPVGRRLHCQPAVRTARSDAAMVRAFSINAQ